MLIKLKSLYDLDRTIQKEGIFSLRSWLWKTLILASISYFVETS